MKRTIMLGLALGFTGAYGFANTAASVKKAVETKAHEEHKAAEETLAPSITLGELKNAVDTKSAVLLDANSEKSYREGHIPGAISFAQNEGKLDKVLPANKNALIVAYCGGKCSAWEGAAKEAKKLGYVNVHHFKGGIDGWKEAKYPTEAGKVQR